MHMPTCAAVMLSAITAAHACFHGQLTGRDMAAIPDPKSPVVESRNYTRPPPKRIAIRNVRVFDGWQILPLCTIVIDGSVIGLDDRDPDEVVDGRGGILLPGLFDAHLHPQHIKDLETLSSYGVTTALSMSCWPVASCNALRGQVGLTDFYTAGQSATSPNSSHAKLPGFPQNQLIRKPSDATWFIANQVGNGSDYIKLVAEENGMNQEEHNALVNKAHDYNMRVMTHAADYASYKMAIQSQTDVIQHLPANGLIAPDMIQSMIRQKQVSTPTLTVEEAYIKTFHFPIFNYSLSAQNAKALSDAGIAILTGTDANTAGVGVNIDYGISLHHEFELLYEAGLSTVEILRGATSLPSKYFGFHDRGTIQPGLRADLVLIDGDPIANISNTRNIKRVWITGIEYPAVAPH